MTSKFTAFAATLTTVATEKKPQKQHKEAMIQEEYLTPKHKSTTILISVQIKLNGPIHKEDDFVIYIENSNTQQSDKCCSLNIHFILFCVVKHNNCFNF